MIFLTLKKGSKTEQYYEATLFVTGGHINQSRILGTVQPSSKGAKAYAYTTDCGNKTLGKKQHRR